VIGLHAFVHAVDEINLAPALAWYSTFCRGEIWIHWKLAHTIIGCLGRLKKRKISSLDIKENASFTDYFIYLTATANRMLNALADGVIEKTRVSNSAKVASKENLKTGWLACDYRRNRCTSFSMRDLRITTCWKNYGKTGKVLLKVQ